MVRVQVLQKRLNKLDECLQNLSRYSQMTKDEFLSDFERYNSAERLLQIAIEATIDIGNHLVSFLRLGQAQYSSEIADILAERAELPRDLAETWVKMIGLRNLLVHDYLEVNHGLVYEIIQSRLTDFDALRAYFARYL